MDGSVLRGMAKWPDVPAVFGWLSLDRRGYWRIKGQKVTNAKTVAFMNRNYLGDAIGRYYFQNGPQQVFVELDFAPYILVPQNGGGWLTHTAQKIQQAAYAWVDEDGNMGIMSDFGFGLIHDQAILYASSQFCNDAGKELDEATLETTLTQLTAGQTCEDVRMRFGDQYLPVKSLRSSELEGWGQFVRVPKPD